MSAEAVVRVIGFVSPGTVTKLIQYLANGTPLDASAQAEVEKALEKL